MPHRRCRSILTWPIVGGNHAQPRTSKVLAMSETSALFVTSSRGRKFATVRQKCTQLRVQRDDI